MGISVITAPLATGPMATATPTGQMLGLLSDLSFTQLVNEALRNYQSTLALSRSPLANSPLVTPTLVKDEASPTAEERGHGLRLVLQWAVNQLAPTPPAYPLGIYRPLDDDTWHEPQWWRYNILRHRYLDPLHPDDFVDGGRYTESLLALTGISGPDAFFDERNRAVRAVAERLRQQLIDSSASASLQRLALQEVMAPLGKKREAAQMLGIAATFDDIFPRSLLVEMCKQEQLQPADKVLDELLAHRFLLSGDAGARLWLSPTLRAYVYERQSPTDCQRRHRLAATYYEEQADPLLAARHWQRAAQDARAVRVLLPTVNELILELQSKELIEFFQQIEPKRLVNGQWFAVQRVLSDLCQRNGQHEEALAACRQALQATNDAAQQASIYRRMGKLYESRNQLHALRYYQQAVERFAPCDPELAELLKDRGWLYFLRQEWSKAEADLQQALQIVPAAAQVLQADIYDAMANLARKQNNFSQALTYAERALAIREEVGDLLQIAKSLGNLGFLYRAMGEYGPATAAHREAMNSYQKLGNQELTAVAWLNIGAVHYTNQKLDDAIAAYRQSLAIGQAISLPLIELKAHYNLAEALGAANCWSEATQHWNAGYQLCRQHNFDDQEADFLALQRTLHLSGVAQNGTVPPGEATTQSPLPRLDEDEQLMLSLVKAEGTITPKRLMDAANISRATATRRLAALVEKGLLTVEGKGRGTCYHLAEPVDADAATASTATAAILDYAAIRAALQPCQGEFAQHYGVTALGVIDQPSLATAPRKFVVDFTTLPDLRAYRQLKRQITEHLTEEIDLLLAEEVLSLSAQAAVTWLWQTAS